MVKPAPIRFNPDLLARDTALFEAVVPLEQFGRLTAMLDSTAGSARARFRFSRRKDHIVATGHLEVEFPLRCQRCLAALKVPVREPFELVFVDDEHAARQLPDELDPVVLDDTGQIHLVDLLEDELMLHVPTVPRHEGTSDCQAVDQAFGEVKAEVTTNRPFDVLKNLDIN